MTGPESESVSCRAAKCSLAWLTLEPPSFLWPYKASCSNNSFRREDHGIFWAQGSLLYEVNLSVPGKILGQFPQNKAREAITGNIHNLVTIFTISLKTKNIVYLTTRLHEIMNEQNMIKTD